MFKRVLCLSAALLLVLSTSVMAKDLSGRWGLGYFNTNAPVGVRYWATPEIGIDLGVGFDATQDMFQDTATGEWKKQTALSFWFEGGLPYIVFPSERANFFVRPGVRVGILDDRIYGTGDYDETWTVIVISLTLGGEVFFGDHFSLEAGHGVAVDLITPPEVVNEESFTDIHTFDASIAYLGFHFYFR